MKFLEAIEHLKQGKKLQLPGWLRSYIFIKNKYLIDENNHIYSLDLDDIDSKHWEIYQEPQKTIRLNFGEALQYLKDGKTVTRSIWNNDKITLQLINDCQPLFLPYIQVKTYSGQHCQWTPHHQDLLADDYILLDD